jgi:hypothetical protein
MAWQHIALGVFFAFLVPAGGPPIPQEPLPRGEAAPAGPRADTWTRRTTRLTASQVRLGGLGAHTHSNWILFRLPFDATAVHRIRDVRFTPTATVETNVSALRIGSVCTPISAYGPLESWARYTVGGIGGTEDFRDHPSAPTADPTVLGIAVPTRVANYVACGRDGGHLEDPSTWQLEVTWEEI